MLLVLQSLALCVSSSRSVYSPIAVAGSDRRMSNGNMTVSGRPFGLPSQCRSLPLHHTPASFAVPTRSTRSDVTRRSPTPTSPLRVRTRAAHRAGFIGSIPSGETRRRFSFPLSTETVGSGRVGRPPPPSSLDQSKGRAANGQQRPTLLADAADATRPRPVTTTTESNHTLTARLRPPSLSHTGIGNDVFMEYIEDKQHRLRRCLVWGAIMRTQPSRGRYKHDRRPALK